MAVSLELKKNMVNILSTGKKLAKVRVILCWCCPNAGCTFKIRKKMCPLLMATGPLGHVEDYTVDLKLKAARYCIYVHDILIHECVVPLDEEVPSWGFNEKFIMVMVSNSFPIVRVNTF